MPTIDVFSARGLDPGETTTLLRGLLCRVCTIKVWDVRSPEGSRKARSMGIQATPAVVVGGRAIPLGSATLTWFASTEP